MADDDHAYVERTLAELEELRKHSEAKPDLVRRFDEAEDTLPAGYAVVLAAGDCGRAGSKHPIPAEDLIGLARDYCARRWPGEPVSDDELRAGIDWAASCQEGQLPLLIPDGDDAYRVSPAISDRAGFDVPPIPPETWDWLFTHLPPSGLLEVGSWGELNHDEEIAERAWTHALQAEDEPVRAAAAVSLGVLWANRGENERAAVLEPANTGLLTPAGQAIAAFILGLLYDRRKDIERARSHYQQAIDLDYWQASPQASHNLGLLLGELGDADGAEAAFTYAIEARLNPYRASAMHALAITLQRLGKLDRAQAYYERAIASDDIFSDVPCNAALNLGRLHEQQGADDQAMAAYEQALTGCKTERIAEAIWRHARLAAPKEQVDPMAVYQRLLGRLPDYMVTGTTCELGQWLHYQGEHAMAAALLDQAMASDWGRDATEAAFWRGRFAHGEDDVTARAAYQRVIDGHHPEYAAQATNNLGVLLAQHGEEAEALATFTLAQGCYPRGTTAAKAAFNAGLIHERAGRTDEARAAFEQAIDPGDPILLPDAVARLARLLLRANDQDAAEALLEQWRNADDPELAAGVAYVFEELQSGPTSPDLELLTEPW